MALMSWSKPIGDAVAAERVHGVDEHRVAHHADLQALEVLDRLDRLLAVVDVAGAGVHPAQADQPGGRMVGELLQHLVADRAVDHLLHVRVVAEHERQVEDVELRDDRAHRADADARDRSAPTCACSIISFSPPSCIDGYIWMLSRPLRRALELLAHAHDRLDRRIAERMHVGRLEHHLALREAGGHRQGRGRGRQGAEGHHVSSSMASLLLVVEPCRPARPATTGVPLPLNRALSCAPLYNLYDDPRCPATLAAART